MNKKLLSAFIVILLLSCNNAKQKGGDIPVIDLNENYPKKEIILQDIAKVEYIPLESSDSILIDARGSSVWTSDKIIVCQNSKGDIFMFNDKGKFLKKFNHKGQSGEEYNRISEIILDEENGELLIFDGGKKLLQVYDMDGKYKRTVKYPEGTNLRGFANINKSLVLCYNENEHDPFGGDKKVFTHSNFIFMSKQSGKTESSFKLSTKEGVNGICVLEFGGKRAFIINTPNIFTEYNSGIAINEIANDTIFSINYKTKKRKPLIIRSPKVSHLDKPLKMFSVAEIGSDAYYLKVMLKQMDMQTREGFQVTDYLWDKKAKKFFEYSLKNADVDDSRKFAKLDKVSLIYAEDLLELLEEGKLKGNLKEITQKLSNDDNPVIMKVSIK